MSNAILIGNLRTAFHIDGTLRIYHVTAIPTKIQISLRKSGCGTKLQKIQVEFAKIFMKSLEFHRRSTSDFT